MEFEGRIQKVLPLKTGTSKTTGNEWNALPFVFEYFEDANQRTSDKVLLETTDRQIIASIWPCLQKDNDGKLVIKGGECVMKSEMNVRVGFGHSVKSGQKKDGTPYHMNNIWICKFEVIGVAATVQQQQTVQPQPMAYQPQQYQAPFPPPQPPADNDGLPF